jgi:O-antigen ligase
MKEPGTRSRIHRTIFYFCLLGISFFLPVFGRLVPPFIVLMFLNWLVEARFWNNFRLVFQERDRFFLFSFSFLYILYLIGMAYSDNMKYGREDLEIKLSLLVFPLMFSTMDKGILTKRDGMRVLDFFLIGCVTGTLLLLAHSWYNERWNHMEHAFYYGNLSWFFHSTYLSMYLVFSIAIITWGISFSGHLIRPIYKIFLISLSIYFLVVIILLSSKAGLLGLALLIFFFSVLLIVKKKNWITGIVFLVTSLLTLYLVLQFFPYASGRISTATKSFSEESSARNEKKESTAERIMIWKSGMEIIREHPLFGIGTGDVKDALMIKYNKNDIKPALEKKLNAHNQYIQTTISVGILGFLLLAGMIFLPIFPAIRYEQYLYVIFLLIFALNMVFESMLEIQAGVVYYAFFNTFLFWTMKWKDPDAELSE